jgi:hypothetical protein
MYVLANCVMRLSGSPFTAARVAHTSRFGSYIATHAERGDDGLYRLWPKRQANIERAFGEHWPTIMVAQIKVAKFFSDIEFALRDTDMARLNEYIAQCYDALLAFLYVLRPAIGQRLSALRPSMSQRFVCLDGDHACMARVVQCLFG